MFQSSDSFAYSPFQARKLDLPACICGTNLICIDLKLGFKDNANTIRETISDRQIENHSLINPPANESDEKEPIFLPAEGENSNRRRRRRSA
ncbi:MAG: hypothetical protein R3Y53_09760 [Bacillota bacterium]